MDGLRISEGSSSFMQRKDFVKEITNMAHKHDIYVIASDRADHLLQTRPSAFKDYVEVWKSYLWSICCFIFLVSDVECYVVGV